MLNKLAKSAGGVSKKRCHLGNAGLDTRFAVSERADRSSKSDHRPFPPSLETMDPKIAAGPALGRTGYSVPIPGKAVSH